MCSSLLLIPTLPWNKKDDDYPKTMPSKKKKEEKKSSFDSRQKKILLRGIQKAEGSPKDSPRDVEGEGRDGGGAKDSRGGGWHSQKECKSGLSACDPRRQLTHYPGAAARLADLCSFVSVFLNKHLLMRHTHSY